MCSQVNKRIIAIVWFKKWFNEDYLKLYSHRSMEEAVKEVEFIRNVAGCDGSEKVLDLACGTGRHSLAFGLEGHSVTAVDLSDVLIAKGRKRLKEFEGLDIEFIIADLFSLPDIGTFDLVVNLFTSFGYFDDDEMNQKLFLVVKERLKSDGIFFLDYLHPYAVTNGLVANETQQIEGEEVAIERYIAEDRVYKRIHFPGRTYEEKVKLYSRGEIEVMLDHAGFETVKVWNDYLGTPWKEKGDRQLFMCKKKGG